MKNKIPLLIRLTPHRFRPFVYTLSAVLGSVGGLLLTWFVLYGIMLTPLHYLSTKPDAPISKYYAWCFSHLGTTGGMLFHFFASLFFIIMYFEFLDILKWKQRNEAEQAVPAYPPQGVGSAEP